MHMSRYCLIIGQILALAIINESSDKRNDCCTEEGSFSLLHWDARAFLAHRSLLPAQIQTRGETHRVGRSTA